MNLYLISLKRQRIPAAIMGLVYGALLVVMMFVISSDSIVCYEIDPYSFASEYPDFFFPLIVSIPFAVSTYYLKRDNFLDYASLRISKGIYLKEHIKAALTMCFVAAFFVNLLGVTISMNIADISPEYRNGHEFDGEFLGYLQEHHIILFGFIWSVCKSVMASMVCLMGQIFAIHLDNLFLALLAPFAYSILENYLSAILGLPQISFTTSMCLSRLSPDVMKSYYRLFGIALYILAIFLIEKYLRKRDEKNH